MARHSCDSIFHGVLIGDEMRLGKALMTIAMWEMVSSIHAGPGSLILLLQPKVAWLNGQPSTSHTLRLTPAQSSVLNQIGKVRGGTFERAVGLYHRDVSVH